MATDSELVERWCDGDADAGEALLDRHLAAIYRFVRRRAPHAADDLAQRTFLECVEHRARVRDAASVRAFLLGVARHVVLRDARSDRRRRDRHEKAAAEPAASATSPSKAAAVREEHTLLRRALAELDEPHRTVLELHYWDELSTREIGTVLEIAAGTVKWRLHQARAALREVLQHLPAEAAVRRTTLEHMDRIARAARDP